MAVGYAAVAFAVLATEGTLPAPAPGELCDVYAATIRLAATADVAALRALRSRVTEKPAIGGLGLGTVVVEAGPGVRTLTIPLPAGGELAYDAILTDLRPTANLLRADQWQAEATFLLVGVAS